MTSQSNYFFSQRNQNIPFMIPSTIENMIALPNPPISNQSINLSTSITITTLIRKDTRPRVKKFSGAVIKRSRFPTIAFTTPSNTATHIALISPQDNTTFGVRKDAISIATPDTRRLIINFMFVFILD